MEHVVNKCIKKYIYILTYTPINIYIHEYFNIYIHKYIHTHIHVST